MLGARRAKTVRVIGLTVESIEMSVVSRDEDTRNGGIQVDEGTNIQIAFTRTGLLDPLTLPITVEESSDMLPAPETRVTEVRFERGQAGATVNVPTVDDNTNERSSYVRIYVDKNGRQWWNHGGTGANRLQVEGP